MIKLNIHSDIDASAFAVQTSATTGMLSKLQHHPMSGWLTLPTDYDELELQRIKQAASSIRKSSQYLVCIGIGGSYLGHRALIEALHPDSSTQILYAGNSLSSYELQRTLDQLGDADFSINVISKSGTTTEPAIAFRIFRQKLIEKYGEQEAYSRIYATTDAEHGALHDEAIQNGYHLFAIPDNVGGRYSVLSPVGLLPLAVAGVNVDQLLRGAREEFTQIENDESEPASSVFRYATLRHLLRTEDYDTEVLATFEPRLAYLNEWWKQLFGESEGKDNQGIFPASAIYTTDLHSLGQYMQQGRKNIFETILTFAEDQEGSSLIIPKASSDLDNLNYLAGQSLNYVNEQALRATISAHAQHIPVFELQLPDYSAKSFGALVYFFELACALSASLQGSDPFNQPGVETYKQEMFRLLGRP